MERWEVGEDFAEWTEYSVSASGAGDCSRRRVKKKRERLVYLRSEEKQVSFA